MAVVNKTIGTTARDYSTIQLWDDDDGGGDGLGNDDCTGSCYDDSAFDETATIDFTANSIKLTVPVAERHDGTAGSGTRIVKSGTMECLILNVACTVEWLECNANGVVDAGVIVDFAFTTALRTVRYCLVHNATRNFGTIDIVGIEANGRTDIYDNFVFNLTGTGTFNGTMYGIKATTTGASHDSFILNDTIQNVNSVATTKDCIGIAAANSALKRVKNCISTDTIAGSTSGTAGDFDYESGTNPDADFNLSSDTTADDGLASPPGNCLLSKTSANQFVSNTQGSEDLHLKTGADAIDAGTNLGVSPSGVEIDIDGRDRDAEGDTWDMGADEFVSVVAGAHPVISDAGIHSSVFHGVVISG